VPWIPSLNLHESDKAIISSGQWLNDKVVDAVNLLVSDYLGSDVQTSLMAQSSSGFAQVKHGMQIVYDNCHWVVAAACINEHVVLAVSVKQYRLLWQSN